MRCNNILVTLLLCLLAACGGGGSDGGTGGNSGTGTTGTTSSTSGSSTVAAPMVVATNFQDLVVDTGPAGSVNGLFTSVTVCNPNDSSTCRVIDHVLVDTGSTGLRLLAEAVPTALRLTQQASASGGALAECTQFADGFSWGPIKAAGVKLGGELIAALAIQIIGDPAFANIPAACSASGPSENTVALFGANGVLGVGNFANDCGGACANTSSNSSYYSCDASGCVGVRVALAEQVQNPVTKLAKDNNGVVIRLPTPPPEGAASIAGTIIFGIGTQANNALGSARVFTVSAASGTLPITLNGTTYANSYIDSGSNANFFDSPGTPVCSSGFYCPLSPLTIATVVQGLNGTSASFNFTVSHADNFFRDHPGFAIAPNLGGTTISGGGVDLGLPFFYGRTVYTAVEGRATSGGTGPYVAF